MIYYSISNRILTLESSPTWGRGLKFGIEFALDYSGCVSRCLCVFVEYEVCCECFLFGIVADVLGVPHFLIQVMTERMAPVSCCTLDGEFGEVFCSVDGWIRGDGVVPLSFCKQGDIAKNDGPVFFREFGVREPFCQVFLAAHRGFVHPFCVERDVCLILG